MIDRKITKAVRVGGLMLGGGNPVLVQSMLNARADDIPANVAQAQRLEAAGCQLVRVTVPTPAHARVVTALKEAVSMPVVADIHFDYKAALACAEAGVDKIRINPGNIGSDEHVREVADALLEKHDFDNIVISIKSSNVPVMMQAYRLLSAQCSYPLHIGVTEAGTYRMGLIKSAMGIGGLLMEGIGDTLRVSLTDEPEKEVQAGYDILRAAGYPVAGPEIVSCPTCGRTNIDVAGIANEVERRLRERGCTRSIKVAVMGCVVNGPGEAKGADIGIAGGKDCAMLFVKGQQKRMLRGDIVGELIREIEQME